MAYLVYISGMKYWYDIPTHINKKIQYLLTIWRPPYNLLDCALHVSWLWHCLFHQIHSLLFSKVTYKGIKCFFACLPPHPHFSQDVTRQLEKMSVLGVFCGGKWHVYVVKWQCHLKLTDLLPNKMIMTLCAVILSASSTSPVAAVKKNIHLSGSNYLSLLTSQIYFHLFCFSIDCCLCSPVQCNPWNGHLTWVDNSMLE